MLQDSDFSITSSFELSGISVISLSRCSLALSLLVTGFPTEASTYYGVSDDPEAQITNKWAEKKIAKKK